MTSEVSTSDPSFQVEFLGPKQREFQKGRLNVSVRGKKRRAEPGHVVVGAQHSAYTRRAVFYATCQTPLVRDLTQVSVRFGTSTLVLPTVSTSLLRCSSNSRFLSPGLAQQGLSRLLRPCPCDCLVTPGCLRSSCSCRQCPTPRLASTSECCVQSQLLTAAHAQRLRMIVFCKPPSCRCQRLSLRCTSCDVEASLEQGLGLSTEPLIRQARNSAWKCLKKKVKGGSSTLAPKGAHPHGSPDSPSPNLCLKVLPIEGDS